MCLCIISLIFSFICRLFPEKMLVPLTGANSWQPVMEFALLVDAGKPFYEETFLLEGDGFLASGVRSSVETGWPSPSLGLRKRWRSFQCAQRGPCALPLSVLTVQMLTSTFLGQDERCLPQQRWLWRCQQCHDTSLGRRRPGSSLCAEASAVQKQMGH